MKKLTKEQMKILSFMAVVVVLIALVISVVGLVKTIKSKKTVQEVSNLNDNIVEELQINENDTTEINIQELENIEENEEKQQNSKNTKLSSNSKYYIKVNYTANVVTIYTKDDNGEYTVPYKAMLCSTGGGTPRSGTYPIKSRWRWGALFGGVYGQYCVHIVGNILFHSVPYLSKSPDSLEYWEYDKLRNICFNGVYKVKGIRCIVDI